MFLVTCKRVVYRFSTGFLQFRDDVFGEGVARTCKVTVQLLYGACTGPYGACASTVRTRTCLRTPVELYDHCTWHVPSTGGKRCACTTFRHRLLTGIGGLYGLKKKTVELRAGPCGPVRYAVRSSTGHWNFGPYGARKLSGSSM